MLRIPFLFNAEGTNNVRLLLPRSWSHTPFIVFHFWDVLHEAENLHAFGVYVRVYVFMVVISIITHCYFWSWIGFFSTTWTRLLWAIVAIIVILLFVVVFDELFFFVSLVHVFVLKCEKKIHALRTWQNDRSTCI